VIRFFCDCGTEIFFDNNFCSVCGKTLGFDPERQTLLSFKQITAEDWQTEDSIFKLCSLRQVIGCNWLLSSQDSQSQCSSCRLTRTIPDQGIQKNRVRWARLEEKKRRSLYTLLRLGLPLDISTISTSNNKLAHKPYPPLRFDFLEDQRTNPDVNTEFIYSGHQDGIITLNAAEADDSFRAVNRELMNELYRTLLGHFRHELGHYYAYLLEDVDSATAFQQVFGDRLQDYKTALERYYAEGPTQVWRENYITAYATSHPVEDWAETWAHYCHITDTLETAIAYGLIPQPKPDTSITEKIADWTQLTVMLNALNRSMGVDDAYPFIITPKITEKLQLIDHLVVSWRECDHSAAKL
jgi:hypothetical protein